MFGSTNVLIIMRWIVLGHFGAVVESFSSSTSLTLLAR